MVKIQTTSGDFISNRIVKMRKEKGLTQAELAQKVNLSSPTISAIENNQSSVSFDKFIEIALVCDYEIVADQYTFIVRPLEK